MPRKKANQFKLRLDDAELNALSKLTLNAGLFSRSQWLRNEIRRAAKRKGLWPQSPAT